MSQFALALAVLSFIIWVGLLTIWGQFWRTDQQLNEIEDTTTNSTITTIHPSSLLSFPSIAVVIPARNEADLLPTTLRSLLTQDYSGTITIVLVDDNSTDGTAKVAQTLAQSLGKAQQLIVLSGEALPTGWTGKLWAMAQGVQQAETIVPTPDYLLLTDADIEHDPGNLRRLVTKAEQDQLDLVSLMVRLRCDSFGKNFSFPPLSFSFKKLYPFRWVNHPTRRMAAAAGGCILIRCETLKQIGGIAAIHQALIDDCALAYAVKSTNQVTSNQGRIWLGLSSLTRSLRPYPSLTSIWDMVARTAFTQLSYSPWLLLGTVLGMLLVYVVPIVAAIGGGLAGNWLLSTTGLATWLLMTIAYFPMVWFYRCSPLFSGCLPIIAFLYTLMTIDSALRHWQGRGGAWKGRTYNKVPA